jgi:tryptophan 2,3-dioxygenase
MSYGPDQILEGEGNSDYERYIRTSELLRLQKGPDEWVHRDELLFTVVHQTSELWLKLATSELSRRPGWCHHAERLDNDLIYYLRNHFKV